MAAHGVPDSRQLQEGDILNIDVTVSGMEHIRNSVKHFITRIPFQVFHGGFHGDVSDTFTVGKVDEHAEKLIRKGAR